MVGHECTADCVVDWSYSMPNMVWNFKPVDFKFSTLYQTNIWSKKVYFIAATYFSKYGYQNSIMKHGYF